MAGERKLELGDAEFALGLFDALLPGGAAGRLMERVVEEEQVAEPGVDAPAP